jgi:hypothetical protein
VPIFETHHLQSALWRRHFALSKWLLELGHIKIAIKGTAGIASLKHAINGGSEECFDYLLELGVPLDITVYWEAATTRDTDFLDKLERLGCPDERTHGLHDAGCNLQTCAVTANPCNALSIHQSLACRRGGYNDKVWRWFFSRGFKMRPSCLTFLADNNVPLEDFEMIHEQQPDIFKDPEVFKYCCCGKSARYLQFLYVKGYLKGVDVVFRSEVLFNCIRSTYNTEAVLWFERKGWARDVIDPEACPILLQQTIKEAGGDCVDMLDLLKARGYTPQTEDQIQEHFDVAVRHTRLNALKWLLKLIPSFTTKQLWMLCAKYRNTVLAGWMEDVYPEVVPSDEYPYFSANSDSDD